MIPKKLSDEERTKGEELIDFYFQLKKDAQDNQDFFTEEERKQILELQDSLMDKLRKL
tara:strand:+ start:1481 stop:1654 length:174 start_codon:yes stop_codon:yes gene_type:complete